MEGESNNSVRAPRLCSMTRNPQGYGFNLHGEKGVAGQFISAVDRGGPADVAGLCVGDRVVEVNRVNVEEASHAQVVAKIKENPDRAVLLVVDKVTDEYLGKIGVAITADLVKHDSVLALTQDNNNHDVNGADMSDTDSVGRHEENYTRSEVEVDEPESPSPVASSNRTEILARNSELDDSASETHSTTSSEQRRTSDVERNGSYPSSLPDERISQSSEESSSHAGESGRLSADSKLSMAAALPKPRRRQIKEDKSETWASKAALFNNL